MTMPQIYRVSSNLWDRILHGTFSKLGLATRIVMDSGVETVLQEYTSGDFIATAMSISLILYASVALILDGRKREMRAIVTLTLC